MSSHPLLHTHIETITRNKIYQSLFYKESLFGLTPLSLIEKIADIRYIGGCYGGSRQPSQFLCVLCKLMQIAPDIEIIMLYLHDTHFKYLRILAAFYLRMILKNEEVYTHLEPLLADYSKIVVRYPQGHFEVRHVDEIINDLLTQDSYMDLNLGFLPRRELLAEQGLLEEQRESKLFELDESVTMQDIMAQVDEEDREEERNEGMRLRFKNRPNGGKRKRDVDAEESGASAAASDGGSNLSMSVEETNKLRAQLGIPFLET